MEYIYVLKLENGKIYVGKSKNVKKRFEQHKSGYGAVWTKMYKPIKIIDLFPVRNEFDEFNTTLKYMKLYGVDNVRGSVMCGVKLYYRSFITKLILGTEDRCYKCGKLGHYAKYCPKIKFNEKYNPWAHKFNNSESNNNEFNNNESNNFKFNNNDFIESNSNNDFECDIINRLKKNKELRPYQKESVYKLCLYDFNRAKIIMPCGTGKTKVFISFLEIYNDFNLVLILAPSQQLVLQIYTRLLKRFAPDVVLHYSKDKNKIKKLNNSDKKIIVSTYQSAKKFKNYKFDICIFDEAHKCRDGTKDMGFALRDENIKINKRIYFTATELINDKTKKYNDMLCKTLYGDTLYRYNITTAINDGYISGLYFKTYLIADRNLRQKLYNVSVVYDKKLNKEYDKSVVVACEMIIDEIICGACKKILTFHNTIKNVDTFYDVFNYVLKFHSRRLYKKNKVKIDTFKITNGNINGIINKFEDAPIAVLSSCKRLNEGIDIPCVDGIVFVDNTESSINIVQRIGRGIRLHSGKKACNIYIPVGDRMRVLSGLLNALQKYAPNLLSYVRKNLSKSQQLNEITRRSDKVNKVKINDLINKVKSEIIAIIVNTHDIIFLLKLWYADNKRVPKRGDKFDGVNIYKKWLKFIEDSGTTIYEKIEKVFDCPNLQRELMKRKNNIVDKVNNYINNNVRFIGSRGDKYHFRIIKNQNINELLFKLGLSNKDIVFKHDKIFDAPIKNIDLIMCFYKIYVDDGMFYIKRRDDKNIVLTKPLMFKKLIFIDNVNGYNIYRVPQNYISPFSSGIVKIKTDCGADFNYRNYTYKCRDNEVLIKSYPIIDLRNKNIKHISYSAKTAKVKFNNKPNEEIFKKCEFKNIEQCGNYYLLKNIRTEYTAKKIGNYELKFLVSGEILRLTKYKTNIKYKCKKLLDRIYAAESNIRMGKHRGAIKINDKYFTVITNNLNVNDYKIIKIKKIDNCVRIKIPHGPQCDCEDINKHCRAIIRIKEVIEDNDFERGSWNNVLICDPQCEKCGAAYGANKIKFNMLTSNSNNFMINSRDQKKYYKVLAMNRISCKYKSEEFI